MTKPKVLVINAQPEVGLEKLREKCDVFYEPKKTTPEWVHAHLSEFEGVMLKGKGIKIDRTFMDAGPNLKIIATASVGFDHIDTAYAKQKGIVVANTPKAVCKPTAELAIGLMLDLARRLPFYDHEMHQGIWNDSSEKANLAIGLTGKTLGIFGMGRIGQQVARVAKVLGMTTIYHNRHRVEEKIERELGATYVPFDTLIRDSDVLSLHAPATSQTENIINAERLRQMKKSAFLINVARGALVDEEALVSALRTHDIAGAGLDVFVDEPKPDPELFQLSNVVLTPHVGTGTYDAAINVAREASENLISYLCNHQPLNQVN